MPRLRFLIPLCTEKWKSLKTIKKLKTTPILFLSGSKDEVVPESHMKKLFDTVALKRNVQYIL